MTFVTALFRALFFFTYVPPYDCTALYSSTDTLPASPQLTSPPIAALFSPHSALRYSHQSPHSIPYYVTPPTTPHDTHSSYFSQHQDGGLHASRRCSLLPTLRNTNYQTSRRHQHFTPWWAGSYLHLSKKHIFKNFLGPFPGPRGLLPLISEFPYSRCISSNFFRRFDLSFRFLLHAPSIHLLFGLVNICFRSKVQD